MVQPTSAHLSPARSPTGRWRLFHELRATVQASWQSWSQPQFPLPFDKFDWHREAHTRRRLSTAEQQFDDACVLDGCDTGGAFSRMRALRSSLYAPSLHVDDVVRERTGCVAAGTCCISESLQLRVFFELHFNET